MDASKTPIRHKFTILQSQSHTTPKAGMQEILFFFLLLLAGAQAATKATLSTNGWPTTGNCLLTDPTKPCGKIIADLTEDKSNASAAVKVLNAFISTAAMIIVGDSEFATYKPNLCLAAEWYKKCIDKTKTDCNSNKANMKVALRMKRVFVLSKFIQEDVCKKKKLENKFKSFKFSKCFTGNNAAQLKQEARGLTTEYLRGLAGDKFKASCKAAQRTTRQAVASYPESFSKQCRQKMTQLVGFIVRFFVKADVQCKDEDFKDEMKESDGGNPRDKKRKTVQLISCNHYRTLDKSGYTTCADETTTRNVTLFSTDFFQVDCELFPNKDNGVPNTQCRKVSSI